MLSSRKLSLIQTAKDKGKKNGDLLQNTVTQGEQDVARRMDRFARSVPGIMYTMELRNHQIRMTYLSPAVEDIFGISVEDGLADFKNFKSLVEPEFLPELRRLSEESRRTLSHFCCQYSILHPIKGERWLESNSMPEMLEDGTIEWHGLITDITERKRTEQALTDSEIEFRTLAQNLPYYLMRYDHQCRFVYVNPLVEKLLGLQLEYLVGKTPTQIPDLPDAEFFERRIRKVIKTGQGQHFEHQIKTLDGEHIWGLVRIVPEMDDAGQVMFVQVVSKDITEQKLAERYLKETSVFQTIPDPVWLRDKHGKYLACNQAIEELMGKSESEIIGKTDFDLLEREQAEFGRQKDIEAIEAGEVCVYEEWVTYAASGRRRLLEIRKIPVFGTRGETIGVLGIGRDITERWQMQNALKDSENFLYQVVDSLASPLFVKDRAHRWIMINKSFCQMMGKKREELIGRSDAEFFPENEVKVFLEKDEVVFSSGVENINEETLTDSKGKEHVLITRKTRFTDSHGNVYLNGIINDITDRKQMERMLEAREREYRTLVDHSPEMIIRYDRDCRRIFINREYERLSGLTQTEALGKTLKKSWIPHNISSDEYIAQLKEVMQTGKATNIILEWIGRDGELISHDLRVVPEYDDAGESTAVLAIGHDISRLRQAEIVLRQHEQEFRALVENSPDTICRYDSECRRIYANSRTLIDANMTAEELLYTTPEQFPGGEQARIYQVHIQRVLQTGTQSDFELAWKNNKGKEICSHLRLVPEFNAEGKVATVLAVGRDITEIDTYRKQIHSLAFYDHLTSLPNRALLGDRIRQTIADASWHKYTFGLMILDLDRFKEINDTLGHVVGDHVLREAAARLQDCVHTYDTVARLGGDEFAILLPQVRGGEGLSTIATKILKSFQQPFMVDGRELFLSTSIGIALYPDDSDEVDALFRFADSAMYHAKQQRNSYQFYSTNLTAILAKRMSIEAALRKVLRRDELELYYQPQVELSSGLVIGAEALLRWNHDDQGLVLPDKFISVAEESGLIVPIGEWVLLNACEAAVAWNTGRDEPFKVAINLSSRQFIQNDLIYSVKRILSETCCDPSWIKMEITESLLLEDSDGILDIFNAFNEMGIAISIDDFGTGYSALSYLNSFPVSQIKIDRSFVQDIPDDEDKAELVKAIISIAKALKLGLVAEGVETDEQASYLYKHGCKVAQGYLFSKPIPRRDFEDFMLANTV